MKTSKDSVVSQEALECSGTMGKRRRRIERPGMGGSKRRRIKRPGLTACKGNRSEDVAKEEFRSGFTGNVDGLPLTYSTKYQYNPAATHADLLCCLPSIVHSFEGRYDRVHVNLPLGQVLLDSSEEVNRFAAHLGGPPRDGALGSCERYSKLLRVTRHYGNVFEVIVPSEARKPHRSGDLILLAGGSIKGISKRLGDGLYSVDLAAGIMLNVNRALNHRREDLAKALPSAAFRSTEPVERGLDGNDNVAPHDVTPEEHDRACMRYTKSVWDALVSEVRRALGVTGIEKGADALSQTKGARFSLLEVETCWDIVIGGDKTAPELMLGMAPILEEYEGSESHRYWSPNRTTVSFRPSASEGVVVYPKQFDRMRYEVCIRPPKRNGRHTAESFEDLMGLMDECREEAANRINDLLEYLRRPKFAPECGRAWADYERDWRGKCGDSEPSRALLWMLANYGRFVGGNALEGILGAEKVRRKAKAAGLIEFVHNAWRAVPSVGWFALTEPD